MTSRTPAAIAGDSFAIIRHRLTAEGYTFTPPIAAVVERIIHSTADFEYARLTCFSANAVEAGVQALRAGAQVVTDVQMVRVGISATRLAAFGSTAHCFVAEPGLAAAAATAATTRSALGIRLAAERGLLDGSIVAIGNAPTALEEVLRLIATGGRPALVIGVPVGFVGTTESKAALMQLSAPPWIVTTGYKGGSTIAVAIVNALLRLAMDAPATDVD